MKNIKKKKDITHNFYEEDENYRDNDILSIPEGCRACGGPYPSCISSCPMFDD